MIMYIISIGFCKFAMTINIDKIAVNNETVKIRAKPKKYTYFVQIALGYGC